MRDFKQRRIPHWDFYGELECIFLIGISVPSKKLIIIMQRHLKRIKIFKKHLKNDVNDSFNSFKYIPT